MAAAWIDRHPLPLLTFRFDAVAVRVATGSEPIVEHVEDAWRM